MPRLAYVNGRFLPHRGAQVHIEDRGYQFADGVYEVVPVAHGSLVDEEWLITVERRLFVELLKNPLTQARIKHMLETGKPLRN